MARAIISRRRILTKKGNLIVIVAWKVPVSKYYPEGVKYSFTFVHNKERIIAFDNYNNEGHHRHYFDSKEEYKFESLVKTFEKFMKLVEEFENDKDKRT